MPDRRLPVGGASPQAVVQKQLGPEPITIPEWLQVSSGAILKLVTAKQASQAFDHCGGDPERVIRRACRQRRSLGGACPGSGGVGFRRPPTDDRLRSITVGRRASSNDVEEVARTLGACHRTLASARRAPRHRFDDAGDRALVVFGFRRAREDDTRARPALRSTSSPKGHDAGALSIDVSAGLHSGLVIVRQPHGGAPPRLQDLTGLTPEIAIQLAERSGAGRVLVTAISSARWRNDFDAEPAGECSLSRAFPTRSSSPVLRAKHRGIGDTEQGFGLRTRRWSDAPRNCGKLLDAWDERGDGARRCRDTRR